MSDPVRIPQHRATTCEKCGSTLVEADLIEEARTILARCMRGQVAPSTGEIQRKAALDILSKDYLKHLSDADLAAELRRRVKAP